MLTVVAKTGFRQGIDAVQTPCKFVAPASAIISQLYNESNKVLQSPTSYGSIASHLYPIENNVKIARGYGSNIIAPSIIQLKGKSYPQRDSVYSCGCEGSHVSECGFKKKKRKKKQSNTLLTNQSI
jgi:hypothetical protein